MKYAEVILPLPLDCYTYQVPAAMEAAVVAGSRVLVHFGKKRLYTGIVAAVHERPPAEEFKIKEIVGLPEDTSPTLRRPQFRFWEWIADYYLCKIGEVYKAAVPAGIRFENDPEKGYTPLYVPYVRLAEAYYAEEKLREAFDSLKKARKQETLLLQFLDLTHALNRAQAKEISRKELIEQSGCTPGTVDGLLKRGLLIRYDKPISRLKNTRCRLQPPAVLSPAQQQAMDGILTTFRGKEVCLLHGLTSSGKTEIYIHLINTTLKLGRQVLFLLPEIAITTQITERLGKIFGDRLLVYHSGFSDNERVEVWNTLLHDASPRLVLGVRSSLFLPFSNLGLVIVDEEHETSYKQQDPAPRYHARSAAIVLAGMHGGKVLLGSATPSLDSYHNAQTGKYGLVELFTRYGDAQMPTIEIVDTKEMRRKKIMRNLLFSPPLVQAVTQAIEQGEQAVLFQNRRGFAPMLECRACGWTPHCLHCDVSLVFHKQHNRLECHYCGYHEPLPTQCRSCDSKEVKTYGFGTEKVEEEAREIFPDANVERLDFDSARSRAACETILDNFEQGRTNILIGTQMIAKGLDFGNVSVAGIVHADSLMNFPDFRAHERAFQLMTQLSGRAGRRDKQGLVILQTAQPEHPIIRMVQQFAYAEMAALQLSERAAFHYPPYYRLIVLVLRCRREAPLQDLSIQYAARLRSRLGDRVLGPVTPPIVRVQSLFIRQIILKIEATAAIAPVRATLAAVHSEMLASSLLFKQIYLHYDVDPT